MVRAFSFALGNEVRSRMQAMRVMGTLCVIGLGIVSQGCTLLGNTTRQIGVALSRCEENWGENLGTRKGASAAWNDFSRAYPPGRFSNDYARGFKEGFADYLYGGGTGEPPPLPPRRYRHLHYQTPEGYLAKT